MKPKEYQVELALIDFDNTLVDFYAWGSKAYHAMFDALHQETGIEREIIINEARAVYGQKGTVEYSLLVQNLPSFKNHPDLEKLMKLAKAAFSKAKRQNLKLLPGTKEMLEQMQKNGVEPYIFSDAPIIQVSKRIIHLKIEHLIPVVIGRDSPVTEEVPKMFRKSKLEFPFKTFVSPEDKPHADILPFLKEHRQKLGIKNYLSRHGIMIGDHPHKDIGFAHLNQMDAYLCDYGQPSQENLAEVVKFCPPRTHKKDQTIPPNPEPLKPTHPHQQILKVNSPAEIIDDLRTRNFKITRD